MNKDSFLRYIENDRDCEQDRLDTAVNRGLHRAKNDRLDSKNVYACRCVRIYFCNVYHRKLKAIKNGCGRLLSELE